ncbi:hypothetical protein EA860_25340, partial [Vibrio anguillarum]|nr:hypothetical protein [Vibrio anguillarum]
NEFGVGTTTVFDENTHPYILSTERECLTNLANLYRKNKQQKQVDLYPRPLKKSRYFKRLT